MGFLLLPKLATLNDLEGVMAVILRYFAEFSMSEARYITVSEVRCILSVTKMYPKNRVLRDYREKECIKERYPAFDSKN